jgi:hypothetical protein
MGGAASTGFRIRGPWCDSINCPGTSSSACDPGDFDLTTDRPLRIGFGQTDYFDGRMRGVRLYKGALTDSEIRRLSVPRME